MRLYIYNFKRLIKVLINSVLAMFLLGMMTSCEDELPGVGSQPDLTLPDANFSYKSSTTDYREINFTNLSISANDFSWDFGDGGVSTDKNPIHIFEGGEGTYSVKLIAKDGNEVTSEITLEVEVIDVLVPEFECKSFECSDRSVWGSFSGSGSPTPPDGSKGAKLESSSHFLDQTIDVAPGVQYKISFWYVSASSSGEDCGDLLISDGEDAAVEYVKQAMPLTSNSSDYVSVDFLFTTTANTKRLRFQLTPGDVTGRYDLVEIRKI